MTPFQRPGPFLCIWMLLVFSSLQAQHLRFGGSVRFYKFLAIEESPLTERRDGDLWLLRLTPEGSWGNHVNFEVHTLLSFQSPPLIGSSRIAVTDSWTFLPLEHDFIDSSRVDLLGSFDRLNVQMEFSGARATVGRQAVSWGVSFFWPSMDLFAPFAPQQIDRDYKAGVDAVRVTVPFGSFSEFEVIGAAQGPSLREDGTAAALLRLNAGSADFGFMGGRFHRDTVGGAFLTADIRGTGLRGEITWTQSGDPQDLLLDRREFLRGSVGLLRQLTPSTSVTAELAWNGFGTADPAEYLSFLEADRVSRGEINALGRNYVGVSVNWLLHPLWTFNHSLLVNLNDHSSLWVPSLNWSTGNNSDLLLGAQLGVGDGLSPDGVPQSEYGAAANTIFAAFRFYF